MALGAVGVPGYLATTTRGTRRPFISKWDWGDGAFVDDDAKKCTVRTGAQRNRLQAKVWAIFFVAVGLGWQLVG